MTQKSEPRRRQWIGREILTNKAVLILWKETVLRDTVRVRKAREQRGWSVRQTLVCSAFNLEAEHRGGLLAPPRSYC